MANLGSLAALQAAIDAAITTNGANDITGAILNTILTDSADTLVGVGVQPKVYKALLTQTGTAAPVATVLVNTLGGTVVWTRDLAGNYTATLVAAWVINKTFIPATSGTVPGGAYTYSVYRANADAISLVTEDGGTPSDDVIVSDPAYIEILVYP